MEKFKLVQSRIINRRRYNDLVEDINILNLNINNNNQIEGEIVIMLKDGESAKFIGIHKPYDFKAFGIGLHKIESDFLEL